MENITLTSIDLSKHLFTVRCENHTGRLVLRRNLSRAGIIPFLAKLPKGSTVAMEACGGAHHLACQCIDLGLVPKIISPQFVSPLRMSQKNDSNDADAICEAAKRPGMRFVAVKTKQQLELQMLHRTRERYIKNKTALINQIRGFLTEVGIVLPQGVSAFMKGVKQLLETHEEAGTFPRLIQTLWSELLAINKLADDLTAEIQRVAGTNPVCKELQKLKAVGPLTASAMVSIVGNPKEYKNGRNFAASLGLVPRQHSTGGKTRLGAITKCGDGYLRKLLVHGARSVVYHTVRQSKTDPLSLWIRQLYERRGANHAAVALAHKTARCLWGVMAGKHPLQPLTHTVPV